MGFLTRAIVYSALSILLASFVPNIWLYLGLYPTHALLSSNSTVYATDPRISYHGESRPCTGTFLDPCNVPDVWESVSYTSSSGIVETFFMASAKKGRPVTDLPPSLSFEFKGSAIYVYGAPRRFLQKSPEWHAICVDNVCTTVDVAKAYPSSPSLDEPVLIWSLAGLDHAQTHELQLHLLEPTSANSTSKMAFHHLVITEVKLEALSKLKLKSEDKLVEVVYSDTNPYLNYSSRQSQSGWDRKIYSGDGYESFHMARVPENCSVECIPEVRWSFRGTAVAVYGAPRNQLQDAIGHSELCLDEKCHPIDAKRIYNNLKSNDVPVLLRSITGLDPKKSTVAVLRSLRHKLPIRSKHEVITLSKIVYQQVKHTNRHSKKPKRAVKKPEKRLVLATDKDIQYFPTQICTGIIWKSCAQHSPWSQTVYHTSGGTMRKFSYAVMLANNRNKTDDIKVVIPIPLGTSSIHLYGAPRPQLIHPHGKQEACIGNTCYPIDVERAYLNVSPDFEANSVVIWSMEDLDPSRGHMLTVKLMRGAHDADGGLRGMTFSGVVYWNTPRPAPEGVARRPLTESILIFVVAWGFGVTLALLQIDINAIPRQPRRPPQSQTTTTASPQPYHIEIGITLFFGNIWPRQLISKLHRRVVQGVRQAPVRSERVADCIVCHDNEAYYCLVPCGHWCLCNSCCTALQNAGRLRCPVCRSYASSVLRVYRPS